MPARLVPSLAGSCLVLLVALAHAAGAGDAPAPGTCDRWLAHARARGAVPDVLPELSGLAASRRHPGVFWAHNDSGNATELFAIRDDGTIVARFPLRGATARDAEDVAVGPCRPGDARSCIWLGDVGDNGKNRATVQLIRVPEPDVLTSRPLDAQALPFRYADGPRNAEALLVDPRTGRVFVISKTLLSLGTVYRVDGLGAPGGGTAVRVRDLRMPKEFDSYTTAADVHPLGDRILLRTYGRVWELRAPGARALEDVLDAEPVEVPGLSQPQAEAVAWYADGRAYLLGSENAGTPFGRVDCAAP